MKIAFISDIHFGKDSNSTELVVSGSTVQSDETRETLILDGLVDVLRKEQVKYIFVAGDLTSTADPLEFFYCERTLISIMDQLCLPHENLICCAGNHDSNWYISNLKEQYKTYTVEQKDIVSSLLTKVSSKVADIWLDKIRIPQQNDFCLSGILEKEEFVLFILNTASFCNREENTKHGRLSESQLKWLDEKLYKFDDDERVKIVLMHHHPIPYPDLVDLQDTSQITDSGQFLEIIGKHGVNLVLHGHRHQPKSYVMKETNWKTPIAFICAGSLSVNASERQFGKIPNAFHIIDLEEAPQTFILHNYELSVTNMWTQVYLNRTEYPMDAIMRLGYISDMQIVENEINSIIETINGKDHIDVEYESLPLVLKYLSYASIKKKIGEKLPGDCIIRGDFPEGIVIVRKER